MPATTPPVLNPQPPLWLRHVKDLLHERCTEDLSLETIALGGGRTPGPSLPCLSPPPAAALPEITSANCELNERRRYLADAERPFARDIREPCAIAIRAISRLRSNEPRGRYPVPFSPKVQ